MQQIIAFLSAIVIKQASVYKSMLLEYFKPSSKVCKLLCGKILISHTHTEEMKSF
jgi:hypothetical protein